MKRKININYILGVCVMVLFILCLLSIYQPVHFQSELSSRENVVKERLVKIRMAEEKYKKRHGTYTGNFAILVKERLLADSLQYIPFSDGKRFSLAASMQVTKSGKQVPLMECAATYEDYLDGLDEDDIQEITEKANAMGNFPGLKIGDLTTDNNNAGNW